MRGSATDSVHDEGFDPGPSGVSDGGRDISYDPVPLAAMRWFEYTGVGEAASVTLTIWNPPGPIEVLPKSETTTR